MGMITDVALMLVLFAEFIAVVMLIGGIVAWSRVGLIVFDDVVSRDGRNDRFTEKERDLADCYADYVVNGDEHGDKLPGCAIALPSESFNKALGYACAYAAACLTERLWVSAGSALEAVGIPSALLAHATMPIVVLSALALWYPIARALIRRAIIQHAKVIAEKQKRRGKVAFFQRLSVGEYFPPYHCKLSKWQLSSPEEGQKGRKRRAPIQNENKMEGKRNAAKTEAVKTAVTKTAAALRSGAENGGKRKAEATTT